MNLDELFNTRVTTASKFSESLSDAAAVVTVVSADELKRFGGTTLLDVLSRVSGLSAAGSFLGDRSIVAIRGDQTRANSGHILILINGRPVREILEGGVASDILESFPIGILERIEVVKGPGSVLYGSDAFSGVINLITKKTAANAGPDFHASAAEGLSGERSASEELLWQRGDLKIVEAGQYHNWPRWNITERAVGLTGSVTSQNDVIRDNGTGGYLGVSFRGLTFSSSYTAQEAPSFVRGIVGDTRSKRGFFDLGYALKARSHWDMTFNGTYSRSVMDAPDYPNIHRNSYEADLEWTNFVTLSERDRLTFGSVYNHIQGLETYTGVTPNLIDAQGGRNAGEAYIQYERKLGDAFKLIGGVQVNKIGAISVNAVPRGGILWNPSAHLSAKLLYGGAYNAPSLDETLLNHPGLKGNPSLVPEKVGTLDAQITWRTNRFEASADYFHSSQKDLIIQNGSTVPAVYYNDPASVNFDGGEAEAKYYFRREWYATASGLYQVNDSGSGAKNLSPSPATVVKAGIGYMAENGTTVSVFDGYQGHIAGYGAPLNPPASAFHSVSAHLRYDLSRHFLKNDANGFALFLNADDLLNQPVWLPSLGSGSASPNTLPFLRGRSVFFGLEVWSKDAWSKDAWSKPVR